MPTDGRGQPYPRGVHPVTLHLIDRTPRRLRPGVELVLRTVDDTLNDRVPGLAAEVAFWMILSLPPLLLAVIGGVGFIGESLGQDFQAELVTGILELAERVFAASTVKDVVEPTVTAIVQEGRGDVVSIGFVLVLWTASRATKVILTAVAIAYDLPDSRPGWKQRVYGFALTVAGFLVGLVLIPLLLVGPRFGGVVSDLFGGVTTIESIWQTLYWPATGVVGMALLAGLYHLGAPWWTPWRRDIPGAVLAFLGAAAGTVGLRAYFSATFADDAIYEQLAAPIAILLWLYVSAFAVLLGAELNAEIEKMWPRGRRWQRTRRKERRARDYVPAHEKGRHDAPVP